MVMRWLAAPALLLAASTPAHAETITVGASLGLAQSRADSSADSNNVVGLYGRLAFSSRVAGQLEVARYQTDDADSNVSMRTATALLVVDLASSGPDRVFFPTLIAGLGLDHAADDFGSANGHHIEGGLGLELRTHGGFIAGVDLRLGGRTIDTPKITPVAGTVFFAPSHLSDGEYRSAHVTIGVRF
jgi:outer membrane protein with beta-barrel domain